MSEQLTVAVHKEFGGQGIGANLSKLLIENEKKLGYRLSFAECTSYFSTRAL